MPLPPLPEGWSPSERVTDAIEIAGLSVHRAGIASVAPTGEELTGAAASLDGSPEDRAYFELIERVGTFEAIASERDLPRRDAAGASLGSIPSRRVFVPSEDGARYREARSNGVALHDTWEEAAFRAGAELIERDHVLRAWYGLETPRSVELPAETVWPVPTHLSDYDWRAVGFDLAEPEGWAAGITVRGVFALPRRDDLPLLAGFGARATPDRALMAACAEVTQSLAFLWGEEIPTSLPSAGPHADAHLEWLLYPGNRAAIAAWLDGAHREHAPPRAQLPRHVVDAAVEYVDLTPPWLRGRAHLARAMHPAARRLVFGEAPDASHLPRALRIHPIG